MINNKKNIFTSLKRISLLSGIISFVILCIITTLAVLQIKFSFFSTLFPHIFDNIFFFHHLGSMLVPHFKTPMYIYFIFCYLIKNLWIVMLIIITNFIAINIFKRTNLSVKFIILIFLIISFIFCSKYKNFIINLSFYLSFTYYIYFVINFVLSNRNIIIKILMHVPIINIFIVPAHVFDYYFKNKNLVNFLSSIILVPISFTNLFFFTPNEYNDILSRNNIVIKNDIYNLTTDYSDFCFFIARKNIKKMDINSNNIIKETELTDFPYHEWLCFNDKREELYSCKAGQKLVVLDTNLNIKKERDIKYVGAERIAFDNKTETICLFVDRSRMLTLFDINTLDIIRTINIKEHFNDFVLFNEEDNSYILSFWDRYNYFIVVPIDADKKIQKYKCLPHQGYMALSKKNKELYIAFHQQGLIGVYDLQTYKLKRYIRTQYSVKCICYNEQYNVLFAPGYFTGYMDIFLMDGTDKLLDTVFVGCFPRDPVYTKNKLLVPSYLGIKSIYLNLEDLIQKH